MSYFLTKQFPTILGSLEMPMSTCHTLRAKETQFELFTAFTLNYLKCIPF